MDYISENGMVAKKILKGPKNVIQFIPNPRTGQSNVSNQIVEVVLNDALILETQDPKLV